MAQQKHYIAVDLGAESGRVMLAAVSTEKVSLQEIYRFANGPIEENGSWKWDFQRLFAEIKTGLGKAIQQGGSDIAGIAVDSWGIDFGLIGEDGALIENPYQYRDSRTDGMMEKAFELMPKADIYQNTGIQFMQINTIFQLLSMRLAGSEVLAKAKKMLFTADLVSYHLCGRAYTEYSLGSTSQLMDMSTGRWSQAVFDKLGLPLGIMPEIVRTGTVAGKLKPELCEEFGCEAIDIIATGSHDTACAVAAVPAGAGNWAYISSGTWSLMGIETAGPVINEAAFKHSFTNEGGVLNTIRFLKNIMGLWVLQECKKQWQKEGQDLSYSQLTEMASQAEPFAVYINPDYGEFLSPGDMPAKINEYLKSAGQESLADIGQIARAIMEGLAFKYREEILALEEISGRGIDVIHIVGGGSQNKLLSQFTANATGKTVIAGPVEATAVGNVLIQAVARGEIDSIGQARKVVANSFELTEYKPQDTDVWSEQYDRIMKL